MAVLDPQSDVVVVRIVYDGAPLAGKTTSMVALGRSLGAAVVTPAEIGGRTLYFDWLDYTGGLFEGRRIRCQVISVPGQAILAPRRRRLLEDADAIVFVGDSTPAGVHADRRYLTRLATLLDKLPAPPVGIVLQANKRDHAEAVPVGVIQTQLDELDLRIGLVESVATEGAGVREAFVFAVRLALDRVRELMRLGTLRSGNPSINNAQDLLDDLKRAEGGSLDFASARGLGHTLTDVHAMTGPARVIADVISESQGPPAGPTVDSGRGGPQNDTHVPTAPDERVASGFVWPPIDGRLVLHQLSGQRVNLARTPRGDWCGVVQDRWRLTSPADAVYPDAEKGRTVLVNAARANASRPPDRGNERCVVLAADGAGRFRLWRISRIGGG